MEVDAIMTLVSNAGFPVAVCLFFMYYTTKKDEQHRLEIDKLTSTVQNNTLALEKILTLLQSKKEE